MGRRSYLKGNRYMLRMSREISTWWCGTDPKCSASKLPFRTRSTSITPVEGHWEGKGDILNRPDLGAFPFAIECKNDESGHMDAILEAPQWPVWSWWRQAKSQAKGADKEPLLLFSRNRRKTYAVLRRTIADRIGLRPGAASLLKVDRTDGEKLTLCLWDDLRAVSAATVLEKIKRR